MFRLLLSVNYDITNPQLLKVCLFLTEVSVALVSPSQQRRQCFCYSVLARPTPHFWPITQYFWPTQNANPGYNNKTMYFCSCSCGSNQEVLPFGGVCDKAVLPLVGNAAWCYLSVVIPLLILFMSLPRVEWKHRCLLCISTSLRKVSGEERENGWFLPLVFLRITKDLTHLVSPRWDPSECDSGLAVVSIMLQLWWNQAFGEVWNCTCILMLRTAMINTKLHIHSDLMSTTSLLVAQSR